MLWSDEDRALSAWRGRFLSVVCKSLSDCAFPSMGMGRDNKQEICFKMIRMIKMSLAIVGFLFPFLCSCQQQDRPYKSLPVDEFCAVIADPEVQRLDVRTTAEYSEGHIAGSLNINVLDEQFAVMADSLLSKDHPVALYCRSGKRSKKAAEVLGKAGYEVFELESGFNGWQQAGQPVEK